MTRDLSFKVMSFVYQKVDQSFRRRVPLRLRTLTLPPPAMRPTKTLAPESGWLPHTQLYRSADDPCNCTAVPMLSIAPTFGSPGDTGTELAAKTRSRSGHKGELLKLLNPDNMLPIWLTSFCLENDGAICFRATSISLRKLHLKHDVIK